MTEEKTLDYESIDELVKEENAKRERELFRYLDSFKQENTMLAGTCDKLVDQIAKDREAEEAAEIKKAQEEAAAQVSAKYRRKYGRSKHEHDLLVSKGYKDLLNSLFITY